MANPIILDGKSLAEKSNLEIAKRTNILTERFKRPPALAAIIVGEDPASKTYVSMKEKHANLSESKQLHIMFQNSQQRKSY